MIYVRKKQRGGHNYLTINLKFENFKYILNQTGQNPYNIFTIIFKTIKKTTWQNGYNFKIESLWLRGEQSGNGGQARYAGLYLGFPLSLVSKKTSRKKAVRFIRALCLVTKKKREREVSCKPWGGGGWCGRCLGFWVLSSSSSSSSLGLSPSQICKPVGVVVVYLGWQDRRSKKMIGMGGGSSDGS